MKKTKRERSVRIMSAAEESMSSEAAALPRAGAGEAPSAADFDLFFPWVCARLHEQENTAAAAPPVLVRRIVRQEKGADKSKSAKTKKSVARLAASIEADLLTPVPSDGASGSAAAPLYIGAVYDARERLVQVSLGCDVAGGRGAAVPRIMLRALVACAPHQPFLVRFTVRGILDSHALRDVTELLQLTTITELRLDDSPLTHADWHILLQPPYKLRYLSLCRSRMDDAACSRLAAALRTRTGLAHLDLSSNQIGDEGCSYIGALLRVDRHLRYLNLSDNYISDVGCLALLDALGEFPLTCDEIVAERRRRLTAAREQLERRWRDLAPPPVTAREPQRAKDKPGAMGMAVTPAASATGAVSARKGRSSTAGLSMGDTVADDLEPYALTQTMRHNGYVHCVGNSALIYLNLAYNVLERSSVRRAIDILRQQTGVTAQAAAASRAAARHGLLRIVVEGNPLPPDGNDVSELEEVLERRFVDAGAVSDKKKGKK